MTETEHLIQIFRAALERVDPYQMMIDHVSIEAERLVIAFDGEHHEINLDDFTRIFVIGAGKASARMAKAVEDILDDRITRGLVSVKYGHSETLKRVEVLECGHPVPDANGVRAARRIADLAREADAHTLVLNLISGGGSALLPSPLVYEEGQGTVRMTLEDKQRITQSLLACGADIQEINCVRKHISGLKGGRLLRLTAPARSLSFILSDVVGDHLDTIASGLTSVDKTTFSDALAVIEKYRLQDSAPSVILQVLKLGAEGRIAETLKADDPVMKLTTPVLIGTNRSALLAACEKAHSLGYHTAALTSSLTGEAREAAKCLYGIARDVRHSNMLVKKPGCIIAGGETVVTLHGSGKGGRNQEMALAFLAELARNNDDGKCGIHFLSASTDGTDGPTDAAGAFASDRILQVSKEMGLSINAHLQNNDSYHFFKKTGALFMTGPTLTNVCDLHIAIIP
jgi:hydroxypyruvate reductase